MAIKIALAGNPNSGKTTLFNALTGSNQFVGNWPGVTVEKKEGRLKDAAGAADTVTIVDLPGIYSLSPYTPEEVISRNFLLDGKPDVILNIIDGTNLERNLFLTTQLIELGIPVVAAVNMIDAVKKNGDTIDTDKLSRRLGCIAVEISALKETGLNEAARAAIKAAQSGPAPTKHIFTGGVEHILAHIEEAVLHDLPEERQRWYAIKLFERDAEAARSLGLSKEQLLHIEEDIKRCEKMLSGSEFGDDIPEDTDGESIIITERYDYIEKIVRECCVWNSRERRSNSDKIDRILTNRWLALPLFAAIMFVVYFISVSTIGTLVTDWVNDGVFGDGWHLFGIGAGGYEEAVEAAGGYSAASDPNPADYGVWVPGVPAIIEGLLDRAGCADWLSSLILDGIVAGVGAVLGFVPQIFVLFIFLGFLEGCGYMARIAYIMDKIFRKFGLSGKSFIPLLIGTGCGVPGIIASRTIESEFERRMTIVTTTFIPCSAKLPVIALIAGAMFGGAWWVAPSAYFAGIAAVVVSGLILKKTRMFSGAAAPFVMELPSYHLPTAVNVLRSMWERGWSFVKKAGTVILLSTVVIWFTSRFGWESGRFGLLAEDNMDGSLLAHAGHGIAWLFAPLGWGNWRSAVAALTGLLAKENVVSTLGVLYGVSENAESGAAIRETVAASFTAVSAYSFLIFNLLCVPCAAAIAAIRREMSNARWFWFTIAYQCGFAYAVSMCIYQFGVLFTGGGFSIGTAAATAVTAALIYLMIRRGGGSSNNPGGRRSDKTAKINEKQEAAV